MKILVTSCIALLIASVAAAQPVVTLELQPSSVVLPFDGRPVTVVVVLRNTGEDPVTSVRLISVPDPEMSVEVGEALSDVQPNSDAATTLRISTSSPGADGKVLLRVDYLTQQEKAVVRKVVIGTITVTSATRTPLAQVADVEVKTTLDSLDEQHPGEVYLLVSNKSTRSIDVHLNDPQGPTFIEFVDKPATVTLEPRDVKAIRVGVRATDTVQPGKHLLVFPVRLDWQASGRSEHAVAVFTREVTVGIFAESEVLKLLGVPIFALLPGFLILVTIGWMWKHRVLRRADATQEFPLETTKPEFWVVAITASAVVAYVYRIFTKRDYLIAYGLGDVIKVWLVSIVLFGVGLYLFIALVDRAWRWWWTPKENEDPIRTLRKMGRRGIGVRLDQVELTNAERALLMEPIRSDQPKVWVTSPIVVQWQANAPEPLRHAVEHQLEEGGSATDLANLLAVGQQAQQVVIDWKGNKGPRQRSIADVKRTLTPLPIVEEA